MKYWLRYSKVGLLRFVGHLDMLQAWERILRRAGVPLAFTPEFPPRPMLSLAMPLPIGLTSQAEYLELETKQEVPDLQPLIASVAPLDIQVSGVVAVPEGTKSLMGLIRYADYAVENLGEAERGRVAELLESFLAKKSVLRDVRRKGGLKNVDIRPLVQQAYFEDERLRLCLAVGSVANLRVEDLLEYFDLSTSALAISRDELYLEVASGFITPFQYIAMGGAAGR